MVPKTILGIDPGTNILGYGIIHVDASSKPSFVDMGVLNLRRISSPYDKLVCIYKKVEALCELHHPQDLAIESPFYGKNVQVVLKLGRAQGAAMIAAASRGLAVYEYAPREAKMAICGNGAASKEQVALMVEKTLGVNITSQHLDATDALAIAMCHYYSLTSPLKAKGSSSSSWEKFIAENPDRVK